MQPFGTIEEDFLFYNKQFLDDLACWQENSPPLTIATSSVEGSPAAVDTTNADLRTYLQQKEPSSRERRKAQNRNSQRAYRDRKERRLHELELQVEAMAKENEVLKEQLQQEKALSMQQAAVSSHETGNSSRPFLREGDRLRFEVGLQKCAAKRVRGAGEEETLFDLDIGLQGRTRVVVEFVVNGGCRKLS